MWVKFVFNHHLPATRSLLYLLRLEYVKQMHSEERTHLNLNENLASPPWIKQQYKTASPHCLMTCTNGFSTTVPLSPSPQVRSLGDILNGSLFFQSQINNIFGSAHFHLHLQLSSVIFTPPHTHAASILTHSFVTSGLDYCNSLLYRNFPKWKVKIQWKACIMKFRIGYI